MRRESAKISIYIALVDGEAVWHYQFLLDGKRKCSAFQRADTVILPNGNEAQVSAPQLRQARSKTLRVLSWELTTTAGQSLYIKKISRHKTGTDAKAGTYYDSAPNTRLEVGLHPVEIVKAGWNY